MNRKERRAAQKKGGPATSPMATALAQAFRAHQAGHRSDAERLYRDVLAVEPRNATALQLLGALMHQTGRSEEAISLIRQAIAIEPRNPDYHYNLGTILNAAGHSAEAIEPLSKAVALKPDYADAHFELGTAYARESRLEEAEQSLRRVLKLQASNAVAMNNLGRVLRAQGRSEDAADLWQRAAALHPDLAVAHLNIGMVRHEQNRLDEAEQSLRRALAIQPDDPQATQQLAAVLLSQGKADEALPLADRALSARDTNDARLTYLRCLMSASRFSPDTGLREKLQRALVESWVEPLELAPLCASVLGAHPVIGPAIERVTGQWLQASASQQHPVISDAELVAAGEPLLRAYLEAAPNCDIGIERFLTALRANLLDRAAGGHNAPAAVLDLCSALAKQCFLNEYVFSEFASETSRVEQLSASLRHAAAVTPFQLAAFAMYRPLHSHDHAGWLLQRDWPAPVAAILRQQIEEPREEAALRETTPKLTAIDDASAMVGEQFEETPSPRWTHAASTLTPLPVRDVLQQRLPPGDSPALSHLGAPDILIAGCGTGLSAIRAAQSYLGATILALDPSLTRLAYARRQAARLKLGNIEFAQADIMQLPDLHRRFDLIEVPGILHRLADPNAGFEILTSLLKPGGVMRIAVITGSAYRGILAAREFAAAGNYQPDAEGIRLCRQAMLRLPADAKARDVLGIADFYCTGGFRDLVLHPQHHVMSLPGLQAILSANGLTFIGFETTDAVRRAFADRFPDPAARKDVACWHQFETENPDAFGAAFWLHKAA